MNIAGELRLAVDRDRLFQAIHDVAVLRETVPGCEELEQTAPDTYTGTAKVGIAVIKGTYHGHVRLLEERAPDFIRVAVEAKSGHAEIRGDGNLTLTADGDATHVRYDGEAKVRGAIAAIGSRLFPSAAKSLTDEFFHNIERRLRDGAGG